MGKCGNGSVIFVQFGMYPSIVIKKSLVVTFNIILNHNIFIYLERSFSCTLTYSLNINADVLNRKPMVVFTIKEISKLFSLLLVSDVGFPIALSRSTDVLEFFNNSFLSVFFYRFPSHRPVYSSKLSFCECFVRQARRTICTFEVPVRPVAHFSNTLDLIQQSVHSINISLQLRTNIRHTS